MIIKNKNGFTLIETIVSLTLVSMIVVFSLSMMTTSFASKSKVESVMRDQVALRQALLTITKEIRKSPEDTDSLGSIADRYVLSADNSLRRTGNNSVVTEAIDSFEIVIENGKAKINIKSIGGQEVSTVVHLRIGL